jgi:hypothetical protein
MVTDTAMGQEKVTHALERIEQALARIEAAASAPRPAGNAGETAELERVAAAHRTLRGTVEDAIARIDRLLDAGEAR